MREKAKRERRRRKQKADYRRMMLDQVRVEGLEPRAQLNQTKSIPMYRRTAQHRDTAHRMYTSE